MGGIPPDAIIRINKYHVLALKFEKKKFNSCEKEYCISFFKPVLIRP